jgi:hypothetical protein
VRTVKRSIFFDNVRDFNPNSEINKSIISELRSGEVSSFVFKNNGITIVARSITRKGDTFSIDDFQIVNGCQTTNILFHSGINLEQVSVPLRLIGSTDPEFVSSIIVGTNKQNEVRDEQFWALLPFMKNLEEFSRAKPEDERIYIERRENQYRDTSIERTRVLKPADLMKAVAAMFLFQPNRAARDFRGIRAEFSGKIFQKDHSVELYHLAALASYWFDYFVRNKRIDRAKGIYKFYVLFLLVRKFSESKNLLSSSTKIQAQVCKAAMQIVKDNDAFLSHIAHVTDVLDRLISSAQLETREQIRDHIRSESFIAQFEAASLPTLNNPLTPNT